MNMHVIFMGISKRFAYMPCRIARTKMWTWASTKEKCCSLSMLLQNGTFLIPTFLLCNWKFWCMGAGSWQTYVSIQFFRLFYLICLSLLDEVVLFMPFGCLCRLVENCALMLSVDKKREKFLILLWTYDFY